MLTATHLLALMPVILVAATVLVVMLGIAWRRRHTPAALVTAAGLGLSLLALLLVSPMAPIETPLMVIDGLALFAMTWILLAALASIGLAHAYLGGFAGPREEFYLLLLSATTGAMVLVASRHLATLFLGLELLSMPLYGMLAYAFHERRSLEAGIKYLVLSAAGTAFLLFGMALLYAQSGRLDLAGLAASLVEPGVWALSGAALMLVGLGFKLSIVPFHLWTPDVYEGGPAPAVMFLASVSKLAVFVVLLRLVLAVPAFQGLEGVMGALALISMLVGNLLALAQSNLKRLLAYSSIAHFGYLLVALAVVNGATLETGMVYLVTYLVATLGALGVITLMSTPWRGEEATALHEYRGLFWRRPFLAGVLTVCLLSLAGIPPTIGFIGKFYIIALGVEAERWWLVAGIVLGSAIGLYYYLRVLVTLYLPGPRMPRFDAPEDWHRRAGGLVVVGLALLVLLLGVYPIPLIESLEWVMAMKRA
ncbi:NADH-quinone oxidoreductase subunit NuoN [Halomonas sp. TRM85114]|uniref:NADH-quinone oxidoreductase subunit NuoN n=1 Tax=Halomonas jincaotanensis TaxID=2810616 RepID=UPI001BD6D014|nr:NADH-quinone oxidoreductase subunit NuoN [Halomonas jincaotanensis]MBS9404670.1 NADH-quinone oxidoreductase subunit NuoN [Halomonas jincaotanensis]